MRKLIVIGDDLYVRSFVQSGAFSEIDDGETFYVASAAMDRLDELASLPRFVAAIPEPPERFVAWARVRAILVAAYRFRSRTLRLKTQELAWKTRLDLKVHALPLLRQREIGRLLDSIGLNEDLQRVLREVRPDLVIAPTAGTDTLVLDAIRGARELGIPTLLLINGWDNLSSKTTFSVLPDWLGVWGEQSVDHAVRIHGMPRERVLPIGVPTFQHYFEFDASLHPSPYPFKYVLFAGCALPFDEVTALRALDQAAEELGDDRPKIVYRPHPWRRPRARPDVFREDEFRHVVLDRQVRESYEQSIGIDRPLTPGETLPALEYYPSLIGHAELVICPLSTMTIEAALLERPVLLLAYDDHVHKLPPSEAAKFDHFEGLDVVEGFTFCRDLDSLGDVFKSMLPTVCHPRREQIKHWLYFDADTYAGRLAKLVAQIDDAPRPAAEAA